MRSAAPRIPPHGGTESAPEVHHKRGRPAAARDWKEKRPASRPKGVGRVSSRTGGQPRRSFLPLRTLRAADLLSTPLSPKATHAQQRIGREEKVNEYKSCEGEGTPARTLAPRGRIALP